jgi:hypothetical protein
MAHGALATRLDSSKIIPTADLCQPPPMKTVVPADFIVQERILRSIGSP